MGNSQSLRRSIQQERWHDVRLVLSTEDGKSRARTKAYIVSDETVSALHLACRHKAPADVIYTLITTGQPMMESSPRQLSPLHFAMMTKPAASPEVVRLLLDAFPHHVAQPSSRMTGSKTPLHMACEQKACPDVIRMLYDADPSAADVQDIQGQTALDVANQHTWILNPIWRRKVNRILNKDGHAETDEPPTASENPPFSPDRPSPTSDSAPEPAVATATLVADDNTAASQLPFAAVTLVTPTAPPDSMDPTVADKGVCVLCWDKKAEMALVPCGHVCLCTHCCGQTEVLNAALNHQCPVCRCDFKQTLRVYHAGISE